jgi:hypothetical protein
MMSFASREKKMKRCVLLSSFLIIAFASCVTITSRELKSPYSEQVPLRKALDQVTVSVSLEDASVFDFTRMFVCLTGKKDTILSPGIAWPYGVVTNSITCHLTNASLRRFLDDMCTKADLVWQVNTNYIAIMPRKYVDAGRPMITNPTILRRSPFATGLWGAYPPSNGWLCCWEEIKEGTNAVRYEYYWFQTRPETGEPRLEPYR